MKVIINSCVFVLMVLIQINVSQAGELTIPNSFSAGTPAVAAEVNQNFNAVKTEVDDNATTVMGKVSKSGDTMTGNLIVPGVNYDSAKTRYYTVGMYAFTPKTSSEAYVKTNALRTLSGAGSQTFGAPIHLPHNAVITAVDFYIVDNSDIANVTVRLSERQVDSASTEFWIVDDSTSIAAITGSTLLTVSGLSHTVDNRYKTYDMTVIFSSGDADLRISGARITYTVTEPD